MAGGRRARRCAEPGIAWRALLRPAPGGGVLPAAEALLPGRRLLPCAAARTAIRAACDVLGIGPGDEVLAPAYNCGSEIDPLIHAGASVRLYPMGGDLVADPEAIAPLIGPRTTALYVTHYFGVVQPRIAALKALAEDQGLRLIEDCALALGAEGLDGPAGSFGDAAVLSFAKFLPLAGGGALVLPEGVPAPAFDRPAPGRMAEKALARGAALALLGPGGIAALKGRFGRGPGFARETAPARPAETPEDIPAGYYFDPRFRSARMTGLSRRLLAGSDLGAVLAARRRNAARLAGLVAEIPGLRLPAPGAAEAAPPVLPVLVAERDAVCAGLAARGVAASPWWAGFHRGADWTGQGAARRLKDRAVGLPVHQGLGEAELGFVAETLAELLADAAPPPDPRLAPAA